MLIRYEEMFLSTLQESLRKGVFCLFVLTIFFSKKKMGFFFLSINILGFVSLNQTIQKGLKNKVKITLCPTL